MATKTHETKPSRPGTFRQHPSLNYSGSNGPAIVTTLAGVKNLTCKRPPSSWVAVGKIVSQEREQCSQKSRFNAFSRDSTGLPFRLLYACSHQRVREYYMIGCYMRGCGLATHDRSKPATFSHHRSLERSGHEVVSITQRTYVQITNKQRWSQFASLYLRPVIFAHRLSDK